MFVPPAAPKCPTCGKSVYAAEEVKALGNSWHSLCFCCKACGKSLRGGCYKEHDGWPYCEADHAKLFGPKGIGYGSTLGDTGVAAPVAAPEPEANGRAAPGASQAAPTAKLADVPDTAPGATESAAAESPAKAKEAASQAEEGSGPAPAKRGGSLLSAGTPKCPQCGRSVFAAEEVRALGCSWHPGCFCCKECRKSLRAGQYRDHQGVPHCDACYRKLFGPKGVGLSSAQTDGAAAPAAAAAPAPAAASSAGVPAEAAGSSRAGTGEERTTACAPEATAGSAEASSETASRPSLRERMAAFQKTPETAPQPATRSAPSGGRFQANNPKCPACSKSVYAAEEVKGLGKSWHALCFCCKACGKSLRGGCYKEHDGWPYCEADHSKLFGPKGIGYGATLGDTGVGGSADVVQGSATMQGAGAEEAAVQPTAVKASAPAAVASIAALGATTAPRCPKCGKSVYMAEEVKGMGRSWHASCFCCAECGKSLRGGQNRDHDGQPYCEPCHGRLFGLKGIGFGNTLGDTGIAGTPDAVSS